MHEGEGERRKGKEGEGWESRREEEERQERETVKEGGHKGKRKTL